jgi:drug/metabolite transporter (DMT)-like permease
MNNKFLAQIGMVLITMIWGVTFVMVKEALNDAKPFMFATLRFGLAFIFSIIYVNKGIARINKKSMIAGLVCGFCLYVGYSFQNFGLMQTTPSKSAFITSVSVIMVPVLLVIFRLKVVQSRIWMATFLAVIGLYILLDPAGGGLNIGDILTFGCALSFAAHIIFQDRYLSSGIDVGHLLLIQLMFITFFSGVSVVSYEGFEMILSQRLVIAILVTGILATFIALLIMVWAQTILGPNPTAILLSLEPVFATLFSTIFASEILGINGWVGGFIIVFAILSLELFSFKK